ncbi:hypothetical protein JCM17844_13880 [Iodidimonas gelatinilytica]|uniref:Co-chaperone DjlA N-terminal domain-containing protein n=1 Tax=Iodidimonas gelatinilytica TaxID=1236966 RepID=A0A5A7N1I9_9PROT|nr:TerB family tellurite resistance protein [Iodidimonas gelatinilytica]GEQ97751.1 hypothetical protein JCM17844_13880 [Iodidimonas gelatinilytica]GER01019.1 hypothetical protein JCM17845_16420 [Iodidimonas gelatinilytica]
MLTRIRAFFDRVGGDEPAKAAHEDRHVAAAALLLEAASLDGVLGEEEEAAIRKVLDDRFELSQDDIESLIAEARGHSDGSVQLLGFTSKIKDACSYEERVEMIEMLWEVVYADGVLHDYEANLLRRVGGLLYVSDRDRGDARKRVVARMGLVDGGED